MNLTGANTFTGITTISNGTALAITNVNAELGPTPASFVANQLSFTGTGGSLVNMDAGQGTGFNLTIDANRGVFVGTGATATFRTGWNNVNITINSVISGAGNIAKTDTAADSLILNAANTFSGSTSWNTVGGSSQTGLIQLGNALALQNSTLNENYTAGGLTFAGGITTFTLGGLTGGSALALTDLSSQPITLKVGNNGSSNTYTGALTGAAGSALTKIGAGTLSITAANSGYAGTTTVSNGILSIGTFTTGGASGGASNSLGTGPISVAAGAQLAFSNTGLTVANNITLNGITTNGALIGAIATGAQANTLSGTLTLAATSNITTFWSDKTFTITGQVTGAGGLTIDSYTGSNNGGAIVVLNNTANPANNYAGDTTVDAGTSGSGSPTLRMGAANQIPSGSGVGNVTVNGIFSLNGFSQAMNGLNGTSVGTVDGISGTPTLTIGNNNATSAFAGIIKNTAGTLALTKAGSGTATLTGAETYSGATTVNLGTLQFGDGTSTNGTLPGNASVASGGTLKFNYSGAVTYAGSISGVAGGTLTKAGTGTLSFTNASASFAGQINVSGGTLDVGLNTGGVGGDTITYTGATTNPLGTGSINVAAGNSLHLNAGNLSLSNNITLNGTSYGTTPGTGNVQTNSGVWNGALMGNSVTGVTTNTLSGTLTLAATSNVTTNWDDKTLAITGQVTGPGGLIIDNSAREIVAAASFNSRTRPTTTRAIRQSSRALALWPRHLDRWRC